MEEGETAAKDQGFLEDGATAMGAAGKDASQVAAPGVKGA